MRELPSAKVTFHVGTQGIGVSSKTYFISQRNGATTSFGDAVSGKCRFHKPHKLSQNRGHRSIQSAKHLQLSRMSRQSKPNTGTKQSSHAIRWPLDACTTPSIRLFLTGACWRAAHQMADRAVRNDERIEIDFSFQAALKTIFMIRTCMGCTLKLANHVGILREVRSLYCLVLSPATRFMRKMWRNCWFS